MARIPFFSLVLYVLFYPSCSPLSVHPDLTFISSTFCSSCSSLSLFLSSSTSLFLYLFSVHPSFLPSTAPLIFFSSLLSSYISPLFLLPVPSHCSPLLFPLLSLCFFLIFLLLSLILFHLYLSILCSLCSFSTPPLSLLHYHPFLVISFLFYYDPSFSYVTLSIETLWTLSFLSLKKQSAKTSNGEKREMEGWREVGRRKKGKSTVARQGGMNQQ